MARLVRASSSSRVSVDASSVDLVDEQTVAEFLPEWDANGLVESAPPGGDATGVKILCGQEIGHVSVTVQLWDGPPPQETDGWQDVAEIPVHWASPFVDFSTATDHEDPAQRLDLAGPGDYRVRVSGTHRDDGDPRDGTAPVETYLVQLWPDPPGKARGTGTGGNAAGPVTYKQTSGLAARHTASRPDGPAR
ncbi:hypothetical protein [Streptomyces sp. NPDC054784]